MVNILSRIKPRGCTLTFLLVFGAVCLPFVAGAGWRLQVLVMHQREKNRAIEAEQVAMAQRLALFPDAKIDQLERRQTEHLAWLDRYGKTWASSTGNPGTALSPTTLLFQVKQKTDEWMAQASAHGIHVRDRAVLGFSEHEDQAVPVSILPVVAGQLNDAGRILPRLIASGPYEIRSFQREDPFFEVDMKEGRMSRRQRNGFSDNTWEDAGFENGIREGNTFQIAFYGETESLRRFLHEMADARIWVRRVEVAPLNRLPDTGETAYKAKANGSLEPLILERASLFTVIVTVLHNPRRISDGTTNAGDKAVQRDGKAFQR